MTVAATPADGIGGPSLSPRVHGIGALSGCLDCGGAMPLGRGEAAFCGDACRVRWNNRRKSRGAELYDLYMALRYDRGTARALRVLTMLNRLVSIWRAEDRRERAGRRSWTPPAVVAERAPFLRSRVLDRGRA